MPHCNFVLFIHYLNNSIFRVQVSVKELPPKLTNIHCQILFKYVHQFTCVICGKINVSNRRKRALKFKKRSKWIEAPNHPAVSSKIKFRMKRKLGRKNLAQFSKKMKTYKKKVLNLKIHRNLSETTASQCLSFILMVTLKLQRKY